MSKDHSSNLFASAEEERKLQLSSQIKQKRLIILNLQKQIKQEEANIVALELELVNRTPTSKMAAQSQTQLIKQMSVSDDTD